MADLNMGLVTDITDDEKSGGYLPVQGELHYEEECSWNRSRLQRQVTTDNGRKVQAWVVTRTCGCKSNLSSAVEEYHFDTRCNWRRVKDTAFDQDGQRKVYLYRKCVCRTPY